MSLSARGMSLLLSAWCIYCAKPESSQSSTLNFRKARFKREMVVSIPWLDKNRESTWEKGRRDLCLKRPLNEHQLQVNATLFSSSWLLCSSILGYLQAPLPFRLICPGLNGAIRMHYQWLLCNLDTTLPIRRMGGGEYIKKKSPYQTSWNASPIEAGMGEGGIWTCCGKQQIHSSKMSVR